MKTEELKGALRRLKTELESRRDLDREATELLRELDADIRSMLSARTEPVAPAGLVERAEALEVRFAVQHPGLEGVLREVVNALARMGI
jgi:hypothetical protein